MRKSKFDKFLKDWIESFDGKVFAGPYGPKKLADSLDCEHLRNEELGFNEQEILVAFRHLTHKSRLSVCTRVLNEVRDAKEAKKVSRIEAANQWHSYMAGFRHGVTGRAFKQDRDDPNPLARIYHRGYMDGRLADNKAGMTATNIYGYKPSPFR